MSTLEIGKFGETIGVSLAIETGPEKCTTLKQFIESLDTKNVGVNFDAANLVMVTDDDPVKGVYTLKDHILHVHIKDGIMLKKTEPKVIYDFFAAGGIGDLNLEEYFKEMPLGEGNVDLPAVVEALYDIGYDGYLTIERETGDDPISDIKKAVSPDHISVDGGLALIAVVGRGMISAKGTAGRVFRAIAAKGVNIRMIDQGSSEINIIIGVDESDYLRAIEAIYEEFVK